MRTRDLPAEFTKDLAKGWGVSEELLETPWDPALKGVEPHRAYLIYWVGWLEDGRKRYGRWVCLPSSVPGMEDKPIILVGVPGPSYILTLNQARKLKVPKRRAKSNRQKSLFDTSKSSQLAMAKKWALGRAKALIDEVWLDYA